MLQGIQIRRPLYYCYSKKKSIVAAATVGLQTQTPVILDGNCKAAMLKAGEKNSIGENQVKVKVKVDWTR